MYGETLASPTVLTGAIFATLVIDNYEGQFV